MEQSREFTAQESRGWEDKMKKVIERLEIKEEDYDLIDELREFTVGELNQNIGEHSIRNILKSEDENIDQLQQALTEVSEKCTYIEERNQTDKDVYKKYSRQKSMLEILVEFARKYGKKTAFTVLYLAENHGK